MDNSILTPKYIQSILENDAQVLAILGNDKSKIFALQQPDKLTFPFIHYQRSSLIPQYTKDYMGWINNVQFEVACVSNKYGQSLDLANAARHALEWHYVKNAEIDIKRIDIDSINEYALDSDNGTVYVQSIQISMIVQPVIVNNE